MADPQPAAGADPLNPGTAFDPAAFEAKMMATFSSTLNTTLNGFAASLKKDIAKQLETKPADPAPGADPVAGDPPPQESKTIADLNLRLAQNEKAQKAIQEKLEAAEKATLDAKSQAAEEKRVAAFQNAIVDIPFATPKARQQFTDAYLGKVKYAEDGSLIVETDKGPVSHDVFLQTEAENSPHFLAPQGQGGAGTSGGKKPGSGTKINVLNMSTAEILKLSPEDRTAALADAVSSIAGG